MTSARRVVRIALLFAATGCLTQTTAAVRGTSSVEGAGLAIEGLVSKLRFGVEWGYERVDDDGTETSGMLGLDYVVRLGFVPLIIETRCHARPGTYLELRERICLADPWWFDIGLAAGFGPALSTGRSNLVGHGLVGAWADVRLWPTTQHPVLRIEVQRDGYSNRFVGGSQITVGLGWVFETDVDLD